MSGVVKGTSETISAAAPVGYTYFNSGGSASRYAKAKWQFSVAGAGSWTDFDTAVDGSVSEWFAGDYSSNPGSVNCNQTEAPSNNTYDIRLVAALSASGGVLTLDGATCSVSVA